MDKNAEISRRILEKAASVASVNGWAANDSKAIRVAIDFVLGEGTYDRLASETYDALRAR